MMPALILLLAVWLAVWMILLLAYARPLAACWKEPVLRHPVLILESDDWGAGPFEQANALEKITHCLRGFHDQAGRPAVMTLGIILEVPDGARISQDNYTRYHGLRIDAAVFSPLRTALVAGIEAGVLTPQLHGLTHYRPATLLKAARENGQVRNWLADASPAITEHLPDALQSNWIDGASLPSLQLPDDEIEREAGEACAAYREIFGAPRVAVATTFIWNERVEQAWAKQGVNAVVTPGCRYTSRNRRGQPGEVDAWMHNGMISPQGLLYLVRDVYFEPARGHQPVRLIEGLEGHTALGRPTLVEIHRYNFLGASTQASLRALSDALTGAMAHWPQLRFLSSLELADAYRTKDPVWIDNRFSVRLQTWARRIRKLPRFWKLCRITGLGGLFDLMAGLA